MYWRNLSKSLQDCKSLQTWTGVCCRRHFACSNSSLQMSWWILYWQQWRVCPRYEFSIRIHIRKHTYYILYDLVTGVSQCRVHPDCRDTEQCHSGSCIDACRIEQCGTNAICTSRDHAASCSCPQGYTGDPRVACYPSEFAYATNLNDLHLFAASCISYSQPDWCYHWM